MNILLLFYVNLRLIWLFRFGFIRITQTGLIKLTYSFELAWLDEDGFSCCLQLAFVAFAFSKHFRSVADHWLGFLCLFLLLGNLLISKPGLLNQHEVFAILNDRFKVHNELNALFFVINHKLLIPHIFLRTVNNALFFWVNYIVLLLVNLVNDHILRPGGFSCMIASVFGTAFVSAF